MSRSNGTSQRRIPLQEDQPVGLVGNIAEFANDVATLAELQAKLAVHDTKDCLGKATIPVVVLVGAAVLALSSIPVLLLGLASLVAQAVALKLGAAQLAVGVVTLLVAGLAGFVSWKSFGLSLNSFNRSRDELVRNISWIRTVLVHSGRSISRPRR